MSEKTTDKTAAMPTPPWGSDEDFNPERAWSLIQNLRQEVAELKEAKTSADGEREAREAAEARAAEAERDLLVERTLRRHGIPEDLAEFIAGDTEEEIDARAERLAARLDKGEPVEEPTDDLSDRSRPSPALTPGHGAPNDGPTFDPAAIARKARGG